MKINLTKKTIYDSFREQVNCAPEDKALEYEGKIFSWKDLDLLSDDTAIGLMKKGITKKSHVGIWSANSPNWIIIFLALVKLGSIPVLLNTWYKEHELSNVLGYADIEFICYGDDHKNCKYKSVLENLASLGVLKEEKCIAIGQSVDGNWRGLKEKISLITQDEVEQLYGLKNSISIHDTAAMFFTSGTTKLPKGVMLSHYSLNNNSMEIARKMHWDGSDKMCIAVPLFHCFGITASLLAVIHAGCTMYLLKTCSSLEIIKKVYQNNCTILNGVPTMFLAMIHNKNSKDYTLSSLKSGIIAGSPVSPSDYLKICKILNISYLQPSYGQTEASPCITISDYRDSLEIKSRTVGKAIDHVSLRVCDLHSNNELPHGEIGHIQTKGYHVMQSYYKLSKEMKKVIDDEGWLSTGDLGYIDENGYLYVTGRISEMIIRGGENISPLEIEECIKDYPNIKNVKVIGIEADVLQEEIVACIVSKREKEIDQKALRKFLEERLAGYKVPKYILLFDGLPYTASGKVRINTLKKEVIDRINSENEED